MKNRRNYYRILHIQPDAPAAIIKASYRTQMQKLRMHPDLGGDEWNASLLNEAYKVLSDPDTRSAYDREYFADQQKARKSTRQRAAPWASHASVQTYNSRFDSDPAACPFCKTPRPATSSYAGPGNCPGCSAPLEIAHTLRLADASKRTIERIDHREAVTIYLSPDGSGHQGMVRDLSPNGMQLQCRLLLRENQVIRISCTALSAAGRVTFCNRGMNGDLFIAGIEFLTLRFHSRFGTFLSIKA